MAGDHMEFDGVVLKAKGNGCFLVKLDTCNSAINCTLSGKIRQHAIKILEGDTVKVRVSPYDTTRGVITFRSKNII